MKPVAIIGGGILGLTAAFALGEKKVPVQVLEAGPRLGGAIRTLRADGYLAEYGPNSILESSPLVTRLIREVGLESSKIYSDPAAENRYIVRDGKLAKLPGSPLSFFTTTFFSHRAKFRLLAEPFIKKSAPEVEESVGEFVRRRLGQEFLDYAISPMVGGIYAGNPNLLSVRHAFPKLHALEQEYGSLILGQILGARKRKKSGTVSKQNAPKFTFKNGLEQLIEQLAQKLGSSILLNQRILEIQQAENGWKVTSRFNGALNTSEYSTVILALPANALAELNVQSHRGPIDFTDLDQIYYPPVASVFLGFRRADVRHPLDGFGALVPEVERMNILGTVFSSSLFPARAPKGHVSLTTFIGGSRHPHLVALGKEALVNVALEDLRKLLGITGSPTFAHCSIFPKAIPQYNLGFARFKNLIATAEDKASGLYIGERSRPGISLSDAIVAGYSIADRLQSYLAGKSLNSIAHRSPSTQNDYAK